MTTRCYLFFLAVYLLTSGNPSAQTFRDEQQKYPRVRKARERKDSALREQFQQVGLQYPPYSVFIRVFKLEGEFELWTADEGDTAYTHVVTYPITWAAMPGELGPKRQQGDHQVPEGYYKIVEFNPASSYHLSLRINYPNESDSIRAAASDPGGDIFIHGDRVTIGCIPIGDDAIEELYIACVDARSSGQKDIPVHIFPCRMNQGYCYLTLDSLGEDNENRRHFWSEIQEGFWVFEETNVPPRTGFYVNGRNIVIGR